jgi:RimJ/RimL family protein N-acetyltransferase
MTNLLTGNRVRLTAINAEKDAEIMARWFHDSEYSQLFDLVAARVFSTKQVKEFAEKEMEPEKPNTFHFAIRALADDRLVGTTDLSIISWTNGDGWVGVGIGERALWGKGYGTDALRVLLRFAFTELNLHRVSLEVFEYNPRAIRAYEKCGFVIEGRARNALNHNGRRWDELFMGVLREDWVNSNW